MFRHAYVVVCVLCASCGSSQCYIMHDLQFVNAGLGYKRRPYGKGILLSRSYDCLVGFIVFFFLNVVLCFYVMLYSYLIFFVLL